MNILKKKRLLELAEQHPAAAQALKAWFHLFSRAEFKDFEGARELDPTVSFVAPEYLIFNIRGNRYRLITTVSYTYKVIRIKDLLTHQEYNDWRP